jgi:hypothetical protein
MPFCHSAAEVNFQIYNMPMCKIQGYQILQHFSSYPFLFIINVPPNSLISAGNDFIYSSRNISSEAEEPSHVQDQSHKTITTSITRPSRAKIGSRGEEIFTFRFHIRVSRNGTYSLQVMNLVDTWEGSVRPRCLMHA